MRGLAPEEGHGFTGAHRDPHHRARGAVDAARQIDRYYRRAIDIDRLDHRKGLALDRPIEPRPKQRIDDQRRSADRLRIERQHWIFPSARGGSRVPLQALTLTEQNNLDLTAAR